MKNYEGVQSKLYEVIVETKELHRLESTSYDEQNEISSVGFIWILMFISNRGVSYNIMDVLLKDEYLN